MWVKKRGLKSSDLDDQWFNHQNDDQQIRHKIDEFSSPIRQIFFVKETTVAVIHVLCWIKYPKAVLINFGLRVTSLQSV